MDWTGLDWTGLDWTGLDWMHAIDNEKLCCILQTTNQEPPASILAQNYNTVDGSLLLLWSTIIGKPAGVLVVDN
jgi:hypothetical protein